MKTPRFTLIALAAVFGALLLAGCGVSDSKSSEDVPDDAVAVVGDKEVSKQQFYGGDDKKFKSSLKKLLLTEDQVRSDVRAQLLEEQLYKKVTEDLKVSDKEIQDFYNKNKSQYQQASTREVRHILVKTKQKADALYSQLESGGDFAALAKKNSEDPGSKAQGGKLTVSKGQTVPPFDKAAFSLDKNEISKPIKTQYGWHIIQPLSEVKKATTTPLPQAKEAIKQQLLSEKKTKEMREWIDGLKDDFDIAYQVGYAPPKTDTTATQTNGG